MRAAVAFVTVLCYGAIMIKVLENLVDRMAKLPKAAQEEIVRKVAEVEQRHSGVYKLDDDERADILEALEEVRRGDVATDDEVAAVFQRLTA